MRIILAEIHELFQHISTIKDEPAVFRPDTCPTCSMQGLRCHGHYERKADRVNPAGSNLNPIWIYRFYCLNCQHTCSVLPECIPPYRWYLWKMQQTVMLFYLSGLSRRQISQQLQLFSDNYTYRS